MKIKRKPVMAARKINFLITVTDTDEIIDVLDDQDGAIEVARQYTQKWGDSTTVEKQYIGSDGETFDSVVVYQTDADAYARGKRPVKAASEFGSESLRHMNDYDEKYGNSPAKRMAMLFPYFLQDVKDYFSDVDSSWFYINGTQFYDSNYDIDFEVIPIFDGSELPFGTVLIEYRAQESPSLTAKCQENGDIIATGGRFIDIIVEVERYIEETYTEYADNLPAEYWD